jgi:restriction system protein
MARRQRREADWMEPIAGLVGLAVLASVFIPGVRQMLLAIGIIALIIFGIVAFGAIIFGIYRRTALDHRGQTTTGNVFALPRLVPREKPGKDEQRAEQIAEPSSTAELIGQVRSMDWFQFEKLVAHIYQKLGYTSTRRGGANPDGGIDLIIAKDGQQIAVQCKQWKAWSVGVKPVREFLGALTDAGIQKGIFITLRGYTADAKHLAEKHDIEIVNEVGLTQMLESTDIRFDPDVLELLHNTRKFCPKCQRELVIRIAEKGPNPGSKFWGCSGFPQGCRFTMPID